MMTFLLSLHFVITIALVAIILLQKSEGGAWGMGGGAGGVLTPRGQANLFTRITAILAGLFIINCLIMASYIHHHAGEKKSLIDEAAQSVVQQAQYPTEAQRAVNAKAPSRQASVPVGSSLKDGQTK